jgi:hypothetical protein
MYTVFYYAFRSETQKQNKAYLVGARHPHRHFDGYGFLAFTLQLILFSHSHHFDKDVLRDVYVTLPTLEHALFAFFLDIP